MAGNALGSTYQIDALRGRAMDSWQQLRGMLDQDPVTVTATPGISHDALLMNQGPVEQADQTYGLAASNLAQLLEKYENTDIMSGPKVIQFTPRNYGASPDQRHQQPPVSVAPPGGPGAVGSAHGWPTHAGGEIPTAEEILPLLQNQSALLQQLELENGMLREESGVMRAKMQRILDENRLLHLALQRTVSEELMGEGFVANVGGGGGGGGRSEEGPGGARNERLMKKQDYEKWQEELVRMKTFYTSKAERLESELQNAREDIIRRDNDIEMLTHQLRSQAPPDAAYYGSGGGLRGMCLRCARNEAVLPAPTDTQSSLAAAQLRRERDDALEHVDMYKQRLQEQQELEEAAYQQVKKGIEMTEASEFELTQVRIEREQLKTEVLELQKRMEALIDETQRKLVHERDSVRREMEVERKDLNDKIRELTEDLVVAQTAMEREGRQRVDLLAEVDILKGQLTSIDHEYSKASNTIKLHMVNMTQERDAAIEEMKRMKKDLHKKDRARDQKVRQDETELDNVKRRLKQAEEELVEAKEQCLFAFERTKAMEREVHLAQLTREKVERSRSDDIRALEKEMDDRLKIMTETMEAAEDKHAAQVRSLTEALESHRSLSKKLHTECNRLAIQLESSSSKHKAEYRSVKGENKELKNRLQQTSQRAREFEDQNGHYGRVTVEMKDRLRKLDDHSRQASQQVMELLTKQTKLMRDRHTLAKEVEFLREELIRGKRTKVPTTDIIEHILSDIKVEQDWIVPFEDNKRREFNTDDTNAAGNDLADNDKS